MASFCYEHRRFRGDKRRRLREREARQKEEFQMNLGILLRGVG
jgi:hypothetical protein